MKNFISSFYKFMQGRYGNDQLNKSILIFSIIIYLIGLFTNNAIISFIPLVCLSYCLFRSLSKDVYKRSAENSKYLQATYKLRTTSQSVYKKSLLIQKIKYRKTHKVFKCNTCKRFIKVPKNKGKLEVTCPDCKTIRVIKS